VTQFEGPVLLDQRHDLARFDSGAPALDHWLRRRALRGQREGGSRTWVVTDDDRVVGYYASYTAVLLHEAAPSRARRNQPDPLPALLLARLAVDRSVQGHGVGAALLKHFVLMGLEVASLTGVRLLLVHAKDGTAASFYRRYGFEPTSFDELTLLLLLRDLDWTRRTDAT
jgi:GNAT superfamily N-acetyltransferase